MDDPISPQTTALIEAVRTALVDAADPEKAPAMEAYMRDQFTFLGVQSKDRRAAQKPTLGELKKVSGDDLIEFAEACWRQPEREFQYVGADALRKHQRLLGPEHLEDVEALIVDRPWWDTVDSLAPHTVGPLVARHPELLPVMDAWIDEPNFWLARAAIIHQLFYKEATDAKRLFAYADKRLGDTEFFIRKALGWALRQYARVDADAVRSFVAERENVLSGLTKREALKHL